VRAGGDAADGERPVVTSDRTEPGTFDNDVDAGERLPGGAVDYLSGDGTGRLLGVEGAEGCRGAQKGTCEQEMTDH
jgi:hypothetical protein